MKNWKKMLAASLAFSACLGFAPQATEAAYTLNPEVKDFYQFTTDDIKIMDHVTGAQIKDIAITI